MLLVMDVGNSNAVIGLYEGDRLEAHWRVCTNNYRTRDELGMLFTMLLSQQGTDLEAIRGCCISSVVPQLNFDLMRVSESVFGVEALMVGPGVKTGLVLQCDNPREVGADRIVNAVAAIEEHEGPLILIDFGTATTFDVITANAEYRGGSIAPGIQVSADALAEKCAKLPRVDISKPPSVIGKNTVDTIRSALTYGYAEMVDGLVRRMSEEMEVRPTVIATGGFAPLIASIATRIDAVDPLLTLKGLKLVFHKNERGCA